MNFHEETLDCSAWPRERARAKIGDWVRETGKRRREEREEERRGERDRYIYIERESWKRGIRGNAVRGVQENAGRERERERREGERGIGIYT